MSIENVSKWRILLWLACCLCACKQVNNPENTTPVAKGDCHYACPEDQWLDCYMEGTIYFGNIIAIDDELSGFFMVDSTMTKNYQNKLCKEERMEYYRKVRADFPADLLDVHRTLWALPEMKGQTNGIGGYSTKFTVWEGQYSNTITTFRVELKKDYGDRYSTTVPFHTFFVEPATGKIEVMDEYMYLAGIKMDIQAYRDSINEQR